MRDNFRRLHNRQSLGIVVLFLRRLRIYVWRIVVVDLMRSESCDQQGCGDVLFRSTGERIGAGLGRGMKHWWNVYNVRMVIT